MAVVLDPFPPPHPPGEAALKASCISDDLRAEVQAVRVQASVLMLAMRQPVVSKRPPRRAQTARSNAGRSVWEGGCASPRLVDALACSVASRPTVSRPASHSARRQPISESAKGHSEPFSLAHWRAGRSEIDVGAWQQHASWWPEASQLSLKSTGAPAVVEAEAWTLGEGQGTRGRPQSGVHQIVEPPSRRIFTAPEGVTRGL